MGHLMKNKISDKKRKHISIMETMTSMKNKTEQKKEK